MTATINENNKRERQLSSTPPADPPPKKPNTAENSNVVLTEDGDVLLKFINGTCVRVASTVLSLASPVFRKMLGPDYLEGQAPRSADEPRLISLPEDDPTAAVLLLSLLHFEPPSSETITAVDLARLAEIADKYACIKPIALMSEALLKRCAAERSKKDPKENLQTVARLFMASHLLGQKKLSVELSRILVLEMTESFSDIVDMEECRHLSPIVILGLEEQRTAARNLLVTTLSSETHGEICRVLDCDVWPPPWPTTSLRSVLDKLPKAMEIQVIRKFRCKHSPPKTIGHAQLQDICKAVTERVYGIRSDCARQDKWQSKCPHVEQLKKDAARTVV